MPIYKGSTKFGTIYHSGTKIGKVYKGSTLVYNLKKNIDMYKVGNYENITIYCAGYPKPNFKLMTVYTIWKGNSPDLGPFEAIESLVGNIGAANSSLTYWFGNTPFVSNYNSSLNLTDSYGKTYFAYTCNDIVGILNIGFALQNSITGDNICSTIGKYGIVSADGNSIKLYLTNGDSIDIAITTRTKVGEWVVK